MKNFFKFIWCKFLKLFKKKPSNQIGKKMNAIDIQIEQSQHIRDYNQGNMHWLIFCAGLSTKPPVQTNYIPLIKYENYILNKTTNVFEIYDYNNFLDYDFKQQYYNIKLTDIQAFLLEEMRHQIYNIFNAPQLIIPPAKDQVIQILKASPYFQIIQTFYNDIIDRLLNSNNIQFFNKNLGQILTENNFHQHKI